jgi:glycerol-3-phosphate dehydrogenase (NAD(P)+)
MTELMQSKQKQLTRVAVYGSGSWGTALAAQLARNGFTTTLWGRDASALAHMAKTRCNERFLPGIALPESLGFDSDLNRLAASSDLHLLVVPSHAFGDVLAPIAKSRARESGVAWATKGFELGSGRFLHEVAFEALNQNGDDVPLALVTGPTFAKEVALGLPCALTVHSDDADFASKVANTLHADNMRAYTGDDIRGAELGGAMKNVLAVATGLADGMGLGLNARAGLITRGLNEMLRLNACLGGKPETMMGLAGLGDLVLTCTGDLSRNRRLGLALGQGKPLAQAVAEIGQVVESLQTADEVMRLAERHQVELPISERVRAVLREYITPAEGLRSLMARGQKAEYRDTMN